jgi:tetratricopeptide (TPR) repeat protein
LIGPRRARWGAAVLVALALACGSSERRLEAATSLRHGGDARAALEAYKALLADLGEGALPEREAAVRAKALRFAGDVSYLELGDYAGALAYYRRLVSIEPRGAEAHAARGIIGDIYRDRLKDPLAAIAQYADVASSDSAEAPRYQLEVARGYLALSRWDQARTEARILRERWPAHPLSDEAQLLTAQAWALERRDNEALGAFQALVERKPAPDLVARAHEGRRRPEFLSAREGVQRQRPSADSHVQLAVPAAVRSGPEVRGQRSRRGPRAGRGLAAWRREQLFKRRPPERFDQ